ncbi:protein-export chaperone SecB [Marinobacterium marinum]|uniref:Protein-export protein SecB n=1 Tax=Marinobacterium marinum TaxID=2756129 RepID=A0A7W1X0G1_9GAMM|nr:protein-export chaperone SecB [Marinobacterium marinum]MBA4503552.1 protein-export chaperone SecB [Marinobacterium marinum]
MSEANANQPQFALQRVYIKDASLETPAGAKAFTQPWQPEINLEMNTRTQSLDENHHEVVLTLTVTAKNADETAFLVEVQQAAIFLIAGLEEAELHHTLGAFCPNLLFPYAREAVDNFVTKASFPPLMLAPVNFDALYAQQMQQRAAEQPTAEETH